MADPYIHWYTSDFLNGIVDLSADVIGCYTVILSLIADQGGPIDDDSSWLARRCGTSTRRFNVIRKELIELGKLQAKNGLLGNKKMLAEVRKRQGKSNQATRAAQARWTKWRAEHKPQLPLEQNFSATSPQAAAEQRAEKDDFISGKSGQTSQDQVDLNSEKNSGNRENSANPPERTHVDSRGRANPELESPNQPTESLSSARDAQPPEPDDRPIEKFDSNSDLAKLLERVAEKAGFVPRGADRYVEAIDLIRQWRDLGVDFEAVAFPCIERAIAGSIEPTNSLKRFDRLIRHEHAQRAASKAQGVKPASPPPTPITEFEEEDLSIVAFRADLLKHFGPNTYCAIFHKVRFVALDGVPSPPVLRVERAPGHSFAPKVMDEGRSIRIKEIARARGFTDVWGN